MNSICSPLLLRLFTWNFDDIKINPRQCSQGSPEIVAKSLKVMGPFFSTAF